MRKTLFTLMLLSVLLLAACAQQTSAPAMPAQTAPAPAEQMTTQPVEQTETTQSAPAATPPRQSAVPAPTQTTAPAVVQVSIKGFKFIPADITVKEGDTVTWTNDDSTSHTVESSDGSIKSPEMFQGDTFSFKFTKKGNYPYICGIHPSMKGSVTVE